MKKYRFHIFISVLCAALIYVSCKKTDRQDEKQAINSTNLEEKFFNSHPSDKPLVRSLVLFMKAENKKYHFIDKIIERIGFPRWDKAIIVSGGGGFSRGASDSTDITYIPFAKDSQNFVNASLLFKTSSVDTAIQFLCDWQYASYGFDTTSANWNAKNIFHIFSILDKSVFGRTKFIVTDRRILDSSATDTVKIEMLENGSGRGTILTPVSICTPYRQCCHCGCLAFRGQSSEGLCCYPEYGTVCTTFWTEDGWTPVSGGSYSPGTGGGGSGSSWTPPSTSSGCGGGVARSALTDGCVPGWIPVYTPSAINPNAYDTIGISNILRDNFPCLYGLIHDTLLNANYIAQLAGANLFRDSAYFNLTFEISTLYTTQGQPRAHTWVPNNVAWVDANGHLHFNAKIRLNPFYMENSTKESKISSILHETMHAIIAIRWYQYQNGLGGIDSFYLKDHFPTYWNFFTNRFVPPNELQQHEIIGADYVQFFSSLARPFLIQPRLLQ